MCSQAWYTWRAQAFSKYKPLPKAYNASPPAFRALVVLQEKELDLDVSDGWMSLALSQVYSALSHPKSSCIFRLLLSKSSLVPNLSPTVILFSLALKASAQCLQYHVSQHQPTHRNTRMMMLQACGCLGPGQRCGREKVGDALDCFGLP